MRKWLILITALFVLGLPGAGWAQTASFSLNPPQRSGPAGTTVTFHATVTNTGASDLFMNGTSFSVTGSGLTVDDSRFFLNFPLSLAAGASVTADIFDVILATSAAPGDYFGSFEILGGEDSGALRGLAAQNFSVLVTEPAGGVVPEPGGLVLLSAALAPLCLLRRRRRSFAGAPGLRTGRRDP